MKITIALETSVKGGVIEMVQTLISILPKTVNHLHLICFDSHNLNTHFDVPDYVELKLSVIKSSPPPRFLLRAARYSMEFPFLNYLKSIGYRRLLRDSQSQRLIVVNGGFPGSSEIMALHRASLDSTTCSILWIHSMFAAKSFLQWWPSLVYLRAGLSRTLRVVTPSRAVADSLPNSIFSKAEVLVAPNFLRRSTISPRVSVNDGLRIVCPAAYYPNKGQETLLKAVALLRSRGAAISVSFFGDGDARYLEHLRAIANRLEVSSIVEFNGFSPKSAVYSSANVSVIPSVSQEAFGLAVLESMQLGIATIASRVGGIPEIFEEDEERALYSPNDHQDLARKLWRFVCFPQELLTEGQRLKEAYLERHDPERAAMKLLAALDLDHASCE